MKKKVAISIEQSLVDAINKLRNKGIYPQSFSGFIQDKLIQDKEIQKQIILK